MLFLNFYKLKRLLESGCVVVCMQALLTLESRSGMRSSSSRSSSVTCSLSSSATDFSF